MSTSNLSLVPSQGEEELCVVPVQNKITFTQYKSNDSLSKRYWLEDGEIQKQASAQMTKGTADRVTMPFADFAQALAKQSDRQAFGYGIHPHRYPDKVSINVKGKENPDKNIISRSLDFLQYSGPGVVMNDHDPNPYGQTFTPDDLLAALISVHPEIAKAARIIRGSVSAGIHKAGEAPRTDKGFHLYMPVVDTQHLAEYGALLTDWLWLASGSLPWVSVDKCWKGRVLIAPYSVQSVWTLLASQ